jgi:hypothetical protein
VSAKKGDHWNNTNRIYTQYDGKPVHPDSISGLVRGFIAKTDLADEMAAEVLEYMLILKSPAKISLSPTVDLCVSK